MLWERAKAYSQDLWERVFAEAGLPMIGLRSSSPVRSPCSSCQGTVAAGRHRNCDRHGFQRCIPAQLYQLYQIVEVLSEAKKLATIGASVVEVAAIR
jgi:hypothetical protein